MTFNMTTKTSNICIFLVITPCNGGIQVSTFLSFYLFVCLSALFVRAISPTLFNGIQSNFFRKKKIIVKLCNVKLFFDLSKISYFLTFDFCIRHISDTIVGIQSNFTERKYTVKLSNAKPLFDLALTNVLVHVSSVCLKGKLRFSRRLVLM